MPDDPESLLKQDRALKWDAKRKRYVEKIIGSDGKAYMPKNEAGKSIDAKKKDPELYKKWMKRTHLRVQRAGE